MINVVKATNSSQDPILSKLQQLEPVSQWNKCDSAAK
jgi:hypothetical protein